LPWAARSLAYGLGLPHAGGGPMDYRTQYSNIIFCSSLGCHRAKKEIAIGMVLKCGILLLEF
jgi:hypothetical protein